MNENPSASDWAATRGDKWREHVAEMEATLETMNEPLIRALELEAPCRIADLGCGGGATTLELLRRAPSGSVVRGFDVSPALIDHARRRIRPEERAIAFEVADVATTRAEEPFDRLVSRFGVMFFDAPQAAFTNLLRWLEPGGRFAFATWGPPAENPWMTSVRDVVARIVELPTADEDAPGAFRYARSDKLLAVLDEAGFRDLQVRDWTGALPIGGARSPADAARFALAAFASFGELLAQRGRGAVDEAEHALTERFAPHHRDGAVRLDACVHIFTGARP